MTGVALPSETLACRKTQERRILALAGRNKHSHSGAAHFRNVPARRRMLSIGKTRRIVAMAGAGPRCGGSSCWSGFLFLHNMIGCTYIQSLRERVLTGFLYPSPRSEAQSVEKISEHRWRAYATHQGARRWTGSTTKF